MRKFSGLSTLWEPVTDTVYRTCGCQRRRCRRRCCFTGAGSDAAFTDKSTTSSVRPSLKAYSQRMTPKYISLTGLGVTVAAKGFFFRRGGDVCTWHQRVALVERKREKSPTWDTPPSPASLPKLDVLPPLRRTRWSRHYKSLRLIHFRVVNFSRFFRFYCNIVVISNRASRPEDVPWRPAPTGKRSP